MCTATARSSSCGSTPCDRVPDNEAGGELDAPRLRKIARHARLHESLPGASKKVRVVAIFPDRGDRYLDTIYSDEWVEQHFGQVGHLWRRDASRVANQATAPQLDAVPTGSAQSPLPVTRIGKA